MQRIRQGSSDDRYHIHHTSQRTAGIHHTRNLLVANQQENEMIKVIQMKVGKQPEVIELERLDLDTMQTLVDGYIDRVALSTTASLYCNELGRLKGMPMNRIVERWYDNAMITIVGDAFICGEKDGENGCVSIGLTDNQIAKWLKTFN